MVEDPTEEGEKEQNVSRMDHEIFIFNPEQPESKQKQGFSFVSEDRGRPGLSRVVHFLAQRRLPVPRTRRVLHHGDHRRRGQEVLRDKRQHQRRARQNDPGLRLAANNLGPLNDFTFDKATSQVYITANDGCLYKIFLDRDAPDEADGDYEGMNGIDEFEDALADGDGEEGEANPKASKSGAAANKNPQPKEAEKPKGKTDPPKNQPAPPTNGGKPAGGNTAGANPKPSGTAGQPAGGTQPNPTNNTKPGAGGTAAVNNSQPNGSLLKSKLENKKYEDAEAENGEY